MIKVNSMDNKWNCGDIPSTAASSYGQPNQMNTNSAHAHSVQHTCTRIDVHTELSILNKLNIIIHN